MSKSKEVQSGGIGFCGLLTILFIALKLTGNITWSWLWILSPIWIPAIIVVAIMLIVLIIYVIWKVIEK